MWMVLTPWAVTHVVPGDSGSVLGVPVLSLNSSIQGSYERYSQTPEGSRNKPAKTEVGLPGAGKLIYFCQWGWTAEGLAVVTLYHNIAG